MIQTPVRFLVILFLTLFLACPAWAGQWFSVGFPSEVGVGKPFAVRIVATYPVDELTVEWDGGTVHPAIRRNGDRFEAELLLGTGLKKKPGVFPLELTAHLWGRDYRFSRDLTVVESVWKKRRSVWPRRRCIRPKRPWPASSGSAS